MDIRSWHQSARFLQVLQAIFSRFTNLKAECLSNKALHITSTRFDHSDCATLVASSHVVIGIHGADKKHDSSKEYLNHPPFHDGAVFVGGLHTALIDALKTSLTKAKFSAIDAPPRIRAKEPANICNRGSAGKGVQLELGAKLRSKMFSNWEKRTGRNQPFKPPFHEFVEAVRSVLLDFEKNPASRRAGAPPSTP